MHVTELSSQQCPLSQFWVPAHRPQSTTWPQLLKAGPQTMLCVAQVTFGVRGTQLPQMLALHNPVSHPPQLIGLLQLSTVAPQRLLHHCESWAHSQWCVTPLQVAP